MNGETRCIFNKGKTKNGYEWMEKDDPVVLQAWYSVHNKIGQLFFHTYSLTSSNKDSSVLLKVKNIWVGS